MYRAINKGQFVPVYMEQESLMNNTYGCMETRFGLLTGSTTAAIPFSFKTVDIFNNLDSMVVSLVQSDGDYEVGLDESDFLYYNEDTGTGTQGWFIYDGRTILSSPYCGMFNIKIVHQGTTYYTETFEFRELSGYFYRLEAWDTVDRESAIFTAVDFHYKVYFEAYTIDNTSEETIEVNLNGFNQEDLLSFDTKERHGLDIVNFPDYWKVPFDSLITFPNVELYDYSRDATTELTFVKCVDRKAGDCLNIGQLTWNGAHEVWNCNAGARTFDRVIIGETPE